jgi:hypothetical protein
MPDIFACKILPENKCCSRNNELNSAQETNQLSFFAEILQRKYKKHKNYLPGGMPQREFLQKLIVMLKISLAATSK